MGSAGMKGSRPSVQELEQVGRCLRLPRVSGARADVEAEAGRLVSVSRAASSQEPAAEETGYGGWRTLPPQTAPDTVPSPSLASGSGSSSPFRGCFSGFSSSDCWPTSAKRGTEV